MSQNNDFVGADGVFWPIWQQHRFLHRCLMPEVLKKIFERFLIDVDPKSEGPNPQNEEHQLVFLAQNANRANRPFRTFAPFRHRFGANLLPLWCQNWSKIDPKSDIRILADFWIDFWTILAPFRLHFRSFGVIVAAFGGHFGSLGGHCWRLGGDSSVPNSKSAIFQKA